MSKLGNRVSSGSPSGEPDLPSCSPRRVATARSLRLQPIVRLRQWLAIPALG